VSNDRFKMKTKYAILRESGRRKAATADEATLRYKSLVEESKGEIKR
jgi:hypothetical protein